MFVGHGPSGLPQDRIVNTFHFSNADPYSTHSTEVIANLIDFYSNTSWGLTLGHAIGSWLSPWVQRSAEIRTYNLDDPQSAGPPKVNRVPIITPFTLPATAWPNGYAEETAVCLSILGVGPVVNARRRGRLFIGPLGIGGVDASTTTQPARPAGGLIDDLCKVATKLVNVDAGWAIRSSRPTQNFVAVGKGYVDNALDSQLRRGPDTTARTKWFSTLDTGLL